MKDNLTYNDLKSLDTVYTHSGMFHSDDVHCCIFLKMINPEINIVRIPEVTDEILNDSKSIIVDVGGVKYDHHLDRNEIRNDGIFEGIKYSSMGLLWKDFGKEFISEKINDLGIRFESEEMTKKAINEIYDNMNENYIGVIDYIDNNGSVNYEKSNYSLMIDNTNAEKLITAIRNSNINWLERQNTSIDEKNQMNENRFNEVINNAYEIFDNNIIEYVDSSLEKNNLFDAAEKFIEKSDPSYSKYTKHTLEAYNIVEKELNSTINQIVLKIPDSAIPVSDVIEKFEKPLIKIAPSDRGGEIISISNSCYSYSKDLIDSLSVNHRENRNGKTYFLISPDERSTTALVYSIQMETFLREYSSNDVEVKFKPEAIKNLFNFYEKYPELCPDDIKRSAKSCLEICKKTEDPFLTEYNSILREMINSDFDSNTKIEEIDLLKNAPIIPVELESSSRIKNILELKESIFETNNLKDKIELLNSSKEVIKSEINAIDKKALEVLKEYNPKFYDLIIIVDRVDVNDSTTFDVNLSTYDNDSIVVETMSTEDDMTIERTYQYDIDSNEFELIETIVKYDNVDYDDEDDVDEYNEPVE